MKVYTKAIGLCMLTTLANTSLSGVILHNTWIVPSFLEPTGRVYFITQGCKLIVRISWLIYTWWIQIHLDVSRDERAWLERVGQLESNKVFNKYDLALNLHRRSKLRYFYVFPLFSWLATGFGASLNESCVTSGLVAASSKHLGSPTWATTLLHGN